MVTERRQGVRGSLQKKQHTAQGGPSSSEGEGAPEDWGGLGPLSSKKPMTSVLPRDETPSQQLLGSSIICCGLPMSSPICQAFP